jgi:S-(hydroxymethyl)glutathione dehydrogenase / alcohol dehydrogenase
VVAGVRGAVWDGTALVVTDDLEVRDPGPGEALVRLLASGICHSDINVIDGVSPVPVPVVPGHEGAGIVTAVGEGVKNVATGDTVVIGTMTPCRACSACRRGRFSDCAAAFGRGEERFSWRGRPVRSYANVSSFAEQTTVRSTQLIPAAGIPFPAAALIGCAVSTGYGVVRNVAQVRSGDTVVVIGTGGIGVNALQTARLAGAERVIAVDTNPAKATIAKRFGAHSFVLTRLADDAGASLAKVLDAAGGPVDAAVECSGSPTGIELAIRMTAPGGTTALVGIPRRGTEASFDVGALMRGRRIVGSLNGAIDPDHDLLAIVDLVRRGELDLAGQVTAAWPLTGITDALDAVRQGTVVRAVIDFSLT